MSREAMVHKLKVYVGLPGKTLFTRLGDPRVGVYPSGFAGDLEPDLVVFPCSQDDRFDPDSIVLPVSVERRLRSGRAGVVFDSSLEGSPHDPRRSDMLHRLLARLCVRADRAVYITQDRGYLAEYQAYCALAHIGPPMTVLNYDFWIKAFFAGVAAGGEQAFERRLADFKRRPTCRPKRFVSLNLSLRPTKALFLLSLLRDGLWPCGEISCGGLDFARRLKNKSAAHLAKAMLGLPEFEDMAQELTPLLPELEQLGVAHLDAGDIIPEDLAHRMNADAELPAFQRSWFTVVTESEMRDRPCRITEKPFKALLNFHPILVLGNPGALDMIRRLGFETFDGILDESYDLEDSPRRRFELVYDQVVRLCRLDEPELARLEAAAAERLTFNARWGLTGLPLMFREEIDANLVNAITAAITERPDGPRAEDLAGVVARGSEQPTRQPSALG